MTKREIKRIIKSFEKMVKITEESREKYTKLYGEYSVDRELKNLKDEINCYKALIYYKGGNKTKKGGK